jgi:minor histocompatibility antigen H13
MASATSTKKKRDASPKPIPSDEGKAKADDVAKFVPPPRPEGLRQSLMTVYGFLALGVVTFAVIGESMVHPVPEGKFEMKDGTLIDVNDFDASDLGPYPKCHPHHEEHQVVAEDGSTSWIKNTDAPNGGPFPVGHPENPEWVKIADERAKAENAENRFKWKGLQPNFHLLTLATLCVFAGCKHGVWLFTEPKETRVSSQSLQADDAKWFPVMGSGVLLGLFLVLKYVGTSLIKMLITCWITMICTFGIGRNADQIIAVVRNKTMKPLFKIPFFDEDVRPLEIIGGLVGACMAATYIFSKNWIINNIFGVSFCLLGIRTINLNSVKTGAIMLIGLFFYDVFWVFGSKSVFGSNVMVSVAMGVEAPIKLMFPRELGGCGILKQSMLGLGDIVVPGLFIAFLAKWDAIKIGEKKATSFVYLNTVMYSYVLSLITTVSIMLFFNAAQPALLYIVPYVLITTAALAVTRGEFKELWYFEIPDEDESEKGVDGEDKNGKKDS